MMRLDRRFKPCFKGIIGLSGNYQPFDRLIINYNSGIRGTRYIKPAEVLYCSHSHQIGVKLLKFCSLLHLLQLILIPDFAVEDSVET